jgi:integrase
VSAQPLELVQVDRSEVGVVVRVMLTFPRAADDFLGDCERRGFRPRSITSYRRTYDEFADRLPVDLDVAKITTDDVRRYLNSKSRLAKGTRAGIESHLASLFKWLLQEGKIARDPMLPVARTRRTRPEDLDVVSVTSADVRRIMGEARSWPERLALGVLCYLGPRKTAATLLRLSDYDELHRRLRFHEKRGKTIWKPIPVELDNLIRAALAAGVYEDSLALLADADHSRDPYLIPPRGKLQRVERSTDHPLWDLVKQVAARVGVDAHVHALRAGFAVAYLERERDLVGLQELLGHESPETTRHYLRLLDRQQAMEPVRSFSWGVSLLDNESATVNPQSAGNVLDESYGVGAGGFEPPFAEIPHRSEPLSLSVESALLDEARLAAEGASFRLIDLLREGA